MEVSGDPKDYWERAMGGNIVLKANEASRIRQMWKCCFVKGKMMKPYPII